MRLVERVLFWWVAAELLLAAGNAGYLARLAREAVGRARRVGAGALAGVNLALALEAALFLLAPHWDVVGQDAVPVAALVAVRAALLASTAFVAVLVWLQASKR